MTRGIAINNPFDIRISTIGWLGKVTPSKDDDFETFDTPAHGIRAGLKNVFNYQKIHHLDTIREIVSKYAPDCENDTANYINAVCDRMKCHPDAFIDLTDPQTLFSLGVSIIEQEQGHNPYSTALILDQIDNVLGVESTI